MKKEIMDIIEESKFKLNSSEYVANKIIEKITGLIDKLCKDYRISPNVEFEEVLRITEFALELKLKIQD